MSKDNLKADIWFFSTPSTILDQDLSIYEKMAYMVISAHINARENSSFPSYNTIAKEGSMSRRKAIDSVEVLIQKGLLEKKKRLKVTEDRKITNDSNTYTPIIPSAPDSLGGSAQDSLVHDMHHEKGKGGAPDSLEVVHDVHPNRYDFRFDYDIDDDMLIAIYETCDKVFKELKEKHADLTIELVEEVCNRCLGQNFNEFYPYLKSAVLTEIKKQAKKIVAKKKKRTGTVNKSVKKPIRKEIVPDWLDEKGESKELENKESQINKQEFELEKKKLFDRIKKYKEAK